MELTTVITCAIGILSVLCKSILIASSPLAQQLEFLSDDGFYYLVLAKNFDLLGKWTFDGGISLTSGFHPLYAYALVLLHKLAATPQTFMQAAVIFQLIALLLILAYAVWISRQKRSLMLILSFTAIIVTGPCFSSAEALVEWPLSVAFSISLASAVLKRSAIALPVLFSIGLLGELTRSDWGLFPVCTALSSVLLAAALQSKNFISKEAIVASTGAVCGAGILFIHSLLSTDQAIQGSAMMKTLWTQITGPSPIPFLRLLTAMLPGCCDNFTVQVITLPALSIIAATGLILGLKSNRTKELIPADYAALLLGAVLSIFGYICTYTFASGGIAVWYTQNLIVPLTIIYCFAFEVFWRQGKKWQMVLNTVTLFAVCYQSALVVKLHNGPFSWHPQVLKAAEYIGAMHKGERVGAFNSGILAYYSGPGTTIVNLDGLVNNDIYKFARDKQLYEYLIDRKINYVADWPEQIRTLAPMLGFNDGKLQRALREEKVFTDDGSNEVFTRFTIYKLALPAASASPASPGKQD